MGIFDNSLKQKEWSHFIPNLLSRLTRWKWKTNFKEFAEDVLFFLSTSYDVISDCLVAEQFFTGTYYAKTVKNQSDIVLQPIVENSTIIYQRECILIGETNYITYSGNFVF